MSGRLLLVVFLAVLPLVSPRIRGADEIEYYAWLRSAVFDGDLHFENEYRHFYERDPQGLAGFRATFLERREEATGRSINFAPLGSAVLWSPLYLLTHAGVRVARAAGATAVPADGYSAPYLYAVGVGSALYTLAGLLLIHDTLRRWAGAGERSATLAVLGIWLATPVLYYMTLAPGFGHACSLFAVALLVWLFLHAAGAEAAERGGRGAGAWALVGAAGGLAALVREQDGLLLVIPGAYLLARLPREPARTLGRGAAMAAAAAAVFLPQLLAYRVLNGHFGPSRLVARKMSYASPHFLQVLFDPGHGLFLWSPLLLLAVAGLAWAAARGPSRRWALLLGLGLLVQVWINGSVQSWSQAGAFGSRRFVGISVAFAWGLAVLLERLQPRLGPRLLGAGLAVFVWWNLSLMVQFGLRLMDRQRLEWPRVAVNQFTEVPPRLGRTALLFFTDRERLLRERP